MIKRIYVSELDRHNLSKYKTIEGEARDKFNYRNLIVKKPWGYEYLLFENDYVAVWILHLKKGQATSVHCHPGKKSICYARLKSNNRIFCFDNLSFTRGN